MNVRLHIERLVLDGLPLAPDGGADLQAAMEAELGRLIATAGLTEALRGGAAIARTRGAAVEAADADAGEWGRRLARATYAGIGAESGGARGPRPGTNKEQA